MKVHFGLTVNLSSPRFLFQAALDAAAIASIAVGIAVTVLY